MSGIANWQAQIRIDIEDLKKRIKVAEGEINNFTNEDRKVKLDIDTKTLESAIQKLDKMLDSLGKGTGDFKQFENLSKELSNIVSEVQSLSKAFGKVDDSGTKTLLSSIQNIDKSLSELSQNSLNVNKNMSNMGGNTGGAVKQVENISNAYQDAAKEAEKLADAQSNIGQKTNISLTSDSTVEQQIKSESELNAEIEKRENIIRELQQLQEKLTVHEDFHGNDRYFADQLPTEEEIREADKRIKQLTGTNNIFNVDKLIQDRNKWLSEVKYSLEEYDDLIKANDQKALDEYTTRGLSRIGGAESFFGYEDNNFSIASKFDEEKEKIQNEINDLYTDLDKLDEKMNLDSNNSSVDNTVQSQEKLQSELKETQKQAEKTAQAVKESTTTASTGQKKDAFHSDIDTSSSVKSLENLEEEIKKIFTDANELQNILDSLHNGKYFHLSWTTDGIDETGADERVRQLSKLLKEYGYTINNFKSDSDAFDTSGVINAIKEENNVLEQNTQKVKENTQAKEQNANVNLNKYDKRLDSYNGKVDKYQATIDRFNDGGWTSSTYLENVQAVKNAVHEYETLLNELKGKDASLVTSDDINRLDNYEKKIKDTIATVTNMSASEKGYSQLAGQKEIDKINKILRESSAMSSEAKAKIKAYKQELISGNPSASLEKIHGEIMKIVNAEELAGRAGKSFFDTLKNSGFHQIAAQMAGMFGLYDIINIGKQAIGVVTELDSAFTEMRKVSDETTQSLKNYQKTTFDTANDVGTTAMQIQNSTADWQRLGYSLDEASELAKNSNIYKNVGDMNIDEATEHMISSVQAWKSEFNDAVTASEEIMNRYNKIGNEFAISSADIGEAMETSAAALKAGGNDLNESIGLITAGNLIQQDASTTASAMKILSLRIRGAKADLDAMGESTDDLSDSTSKMREELKALTGVDIMKDENTFKSTAEIIQEMGKNWDKLTDVSKAAALEKLAGKNRASTVSGLIENYETIGKVIEAAENSENSALEENEKYLESIEGRTQKLTNQLQELASVSIKDDWIKGIISGLTNLLDLVTKLVDKIGIVPTILSGVGIFKGIKTFSKNLA